MDKNTNSDIANQLKKLADQFEEKGDGHRAKALTNSSYIIRRFPTSISDPKIQLKNVSGIGAGTIKRIQEYLDTGKLSELNPEVPLGSIEQINKEEQEAIENLKTVYGIGEKTAKKLYDKGIKSVEDLKIAYDNDEITLTNAQCIGLENYDDFQKRIPRNEVTKVSQFILSIYNEMDFDNVGEVVGSYRRGKETSGDVDILITHKYNHNYLHKLIKKLERKEFLAHILALGDVSFHGTYESDDRVIRKIDIRFVPYESYPSALLHATGSDMHNVLLRKKAIAKGLTLSEHGLFEVSTGSRIPAYTEEDIFEALDMDYVFPANREIPS
jgi:DNA polymerase beta